MHRGRSRLLPPPASDPRSAAPAPPDSPAPGHRPVRRSHRAGRPGPPARSGRGCRGRPPAAGTTGSRGRGGARSVGSGTHPACRVRRGAPGFRRARGRCMTGHPTRPAQAPRRLRARRNRPGGCRAGTCGSVCSWRCRAFRMNAHCRTTAAAGSVSAGAGAGVRTMHGHEPRARHCRRTIAPFGCTDDGVDRFALSGVPPPAGTECAAVHRDGACQRGDPRRPHALAGDGSIRTSGCLAIGRQRSGLARTGGTDWCGAWLRRDQPQLRLPVRPRAGRTLWRLPDARTSAGRRGRGRDDRRPATCQ